MRSLLRSAVRDMGPVGGDEVVGGPERLVGMPITALVRVTSSALNGLPWAPWVST